MGDHLFYVLYNLNMKLKLLKSILLSTSFVGFTLPTIVSCSKQDNPIYNSIYESAVDEFINICGIPHPSNEDGHTDSLEALVEHIMKTAKQYLQSNEVYRDDVGNVWFDIPATEGCSNYKKLVLQAHTDMVWKAQGIAESWDKWTTPVSQPVFDKVDGKDVIHTKNYLTSLGADNGVGMAAMLALAKHKDNFNHGLIRCVFTANEENGAPGAEVLGKIGDETIKVIDHEQGFDYLFNLDSGPVGQVVFNSAGGYTINPKLENGQAEQQTGHLYRLSITGCKGGHSGVCSGDNGANPISVVWQCIKDLKDKGKVCYCNKFETPNGSTTSIPTEAYIEFISSNSESEIKPIVLQYVSSIKPDFDDPNMNVNLEVVEDSKTDFCFSKDKTNYLADFFSKLDYGATSRYTDPSEYNAVKTSANIGVLTIASNNEQMNLNLNFSARFQQNIDKDPTVEKYNTQFKSFCENIGAPVVAGGPWNAWEGKEDGIAFKACMEGYKQAEVNARKARVHGGLECVEFINQNQYLDQVSIGPTVTEEHNVKETLYLDTFKSFMKALAIACGQMK